MKLLASLKRFAKRHKLKIIVAFVITLLAIGIFLAWFLHFRKLSREDVKKRLNFVTDDPSRPQPMASAMRSDPPLGRDKYQTLDIYLPPIRNQGNCGSCTTFAMAALMAISFNKQNKLKNPVSLSPQMLLACRTKKRVTVYNRDFWKNPCDGFFTLRHAKFLQQGYTRNLGANAPGENSQDFAALPLYNDLPYNLSLDRNKPKCNLPSISYSNSETPSPASCTSVLNDFEKICSNEGPLGNKNWVGFRVAQIIELSQDGDSGHIEAIKKAIVEYGAVAMNIMVYDNFTTEAQSSPYIYDPKRGTELDGGHAMVCVGWNCDKWLLLNSWGRGWGMSTSGSFSPLGNGYCWLRFGGMFGSVFAVVPNRVMMPTMTFLEVTPEERNQVKQSVVEPVEDCSYAPLPPPPPPPPPPKKKKRGGFCVIL